jgi:hypothetical protein
MVCETQVFVYKGIDVGWLFDTRATPAVLQHSLDDGIRPLAMLGYFLLIFFDVLCNGFDFGQVAIVNLVIHFINQLCVDFRKVVTKFSRF